VIAIYDQKAKKVQRADIFKADEVAVICTTDEYEVCTVDYDTESQAQYVLDQIASAIERGDKLYRMPSVEEVEKILENKVCDCESCEFQYGGFNEFPCDKCNPNNVYWQPKDKE